MQTIDRDSREYIGAEVTVTSQGQPYNPTVDVVEFAFTAVGGRPTTWYTGGWDGTNPIPGTNTYRAQVLVGPGSPGPVLSRGRYAVFIRITDTPEQPVIPLGQLTVT
ncbi:MULTISPECIES: hypothetical protein [Streptomyces]|uniref:Uncharacterized protein n=1 Tax=Streptomyces doudnae TaxID=3075536 RepID=A0ABD5ELR2_9ACTN|nr:MULTISPECIES: hypothetical protein [unclassified Streptomyces]MDT0435617.1 hypothetical protein [Streptomyces sp. DSM 41981]MYQ62571.1 hypothetical protein [Streptomyces sp. SID4950]SCD40136.1 hypothetical protein GA0115242_104876 [Streptomyces sp. SolWspMP-5a-2]